MSRTPESPYEGYFFGHDYLDKDENERPIDRKRVFNVVGRFADHEIVDNAKTAELEAAGKPGRVMRTVTILLERVLKDAADQMSKDESATKLTPRNQDALTARYPEAWAAYQDAKPKPARKPRAKKTAGDDGGAEIVDLHAARG
jgi:site-specific DNA-cytosine methylase